MAVCIILAAGQGTRLMPLTANKPKCLTDFLGLNLLDRQLKTLEDAGVDDVRLVTGYCHNRISNYHLKQYHNEDYETTNMVYSLFCAKDHLIETRDDVIISYGDIIFEKPVIETLLKADDEVSVVVDLAWKDLWGARNEDLLTDAESMKFDAKFRISELGKKPKKLSHIQGQYIGLIKISQKKINSFVQFYENLKTSSTNKFSNVKNMYMTDLLQLMIDSGWNLRAVPIKNGWLEFDTYGDYKKYQQLASEGNLDHLWRENT